VIGEEEEEEEERKKKSKNKPIRHFHLTEEPISLCPGVPTSALSRIG
jgi:hypothetical protein